MRVIILVRLVCDVDSRDVVLLRLLYVGCGRGRFRVPGTCRPGGLTDAPATGRIRLAAPPVPAGTISRADVAAVIAALLDEPGTRHQTLELVGGDSPVAAAVRST